jgi:predicted PurR-regulated permease PerM
VLGIALLQSLLAAAGLIVAGVPAAGLWSALVLALAVMQMPPLVVLAPAAVWVFSAQGSFSGALFLIWSVAVSASDGFLKPFVLGRGVGVPTLVILLGAIGGVLSNGIVGLFVGAVVLAIGYELGGAWLAEGNQNKLEANTATLQD